MSDQTKSPKSIPQAPPSVEGVAIEFRRVVNRQRGESAISAPRQLAPGVWGLCYAPMQGEEAIPQADGVQALRSWARTGLSIKVPAGYVGLVAFVDNHRDGGATEARPVDKMIIGGGDWTPEIVVETRGPRRCYIQRGGVVAHLVLVPIAGAGAQAVRLVEVPVKDEPR